MKRLLALLCVIACLAALCIPAMAADDMVPVLAKVPDDWSGAFLYAWDDGGANNQAWPGVPMEKLEDGWYYSYIPSTMVNVIINNNNGVQTADLKGDGMPVWITVGADGSSEVSFDAQNTAEIPAYGEGGATGGNTNTNTSTETYAVYAAVPGSWQTAYVWAWDANGTNAFAAWPGEAMTKGDDGFYTANVPAWATNFLIAEKDGGAQTVDLTGTGADQWIVLGEANAEGKLEATVTDSAPEGFTPPAQEETPDVPDADSITVYAAVPDTWEDVRIWAWDGDTNATAAAWPGDLVMKKGDDGWYSVQVPGFVTGMLVNANGGTTQTGDLTVEAGKDVWIDVLSDPNNATVSYEAMEMPDAPEPTEPKYDAPVVPTRPASEDKDDDTQTTGPAPAESNVGLVVGIVVAAAAVVAGAVAIFFILKKKN